MRRALMTGLACLFAFGCLDTEDTSTSFFRRSPPPTALPPMSPASTEAATRVDCVGRRLSAANPQIGAKPMYRTIGSPTPEVFHRGTTDIFITEGMVQQCANDGQLAAVLAVELGKMVRSREADVPDRIRARTPLPPIDDRFSSEDRIGGTPDRTNWIAQMEYGKERQAARKRPLPLPDPKVLAHDYLGRAGYNPAELEIAGPILQAAAANTTLERQITNPPLEPLQP